MENRFYLLLGTSKGILKQLYAEQDENKDIT